MGNQPGWMRQHPGSIRSFIGLWQQEILLIIPEVVNHGVFRIQSLHAMPKYMLVCGIHPAVLFLHDLLYRSDTAVKSFVEVVKIIFCIELMPSPEIEPLEELFLHGFRIFSCIKLLLVLLIKIVDRIPKCCSVNDKVFI